MAYTDLRDKFVPRFKYSYQDLVRLAENDKFKHLASGTKMVFANPTAQTGWTKSTAHNDRALRITSGNAGVTGGSTFLSDTIVAAHVHSLGSHTHSVGNHKHAMGYEVTSGQKNTLLPVTDKLGDTTHLFQTARDAGSSTRTHWKNETVSGGSGNLTATGFNTDSELDDIEFAYVDTIICTKD